MNTDDKGQILFSHYKRLSDGIIVFVVGKCERCNRSIMLGGCGSFSLSEEKVLQKQSDMIEWNGELPPEDCYISHDEKGCTDCAGE